MTHCPSCDRLLPDGAAFCPACGAAVSSAAPVAGLAGVGPHDAGDEAASMDSDSMKAVDVEATAQIDAAATEPIDADATQAIDATAQIAATHIMAPPASSWACPGCGAEAPTEDAFCSRCGTARPEETTTVLPVTGAACAACGAALAADMRFCPRCGARRGEPETAESREETVVVPGAADDVTLVAAPVPASVPPPAAPPPPPPPPVAQAGPDSHSRRGRVAVIAALAVFVVAVAGVCVWWFVLRDTGPAARQAFVEQATPVLQPVSAAQASVNDGVRRFIVLVAGSFPDLSVLKSAYERWYADFKRATANLSDAVEAARAKADAMSVGKKAQALLDELRSALAAHAEYASALAGIGSDPAAITTSLTDSLHARETAARTAYATLAASASALPRVVLPIDVDQHFSDFAAQAAAAVKAQENRTSYLQQVADLFDQTRAARETAEGVLDEFLNTQIPADNAAGQMQAAGADLRAALTQVDALAPPADQVAQQIQNDYHAAVEHWTAAARLYAKWMNNVWGYYQAMGPYPQPGQPLEADIFLDPSYRAAQKEQKLADQTRVKLAASYDSEAARLGLPADFDAPAM